MECWNVGIREYSEIAASSPSFQLLHYSRIKSLMIPMTKESDAAPLVQELRLISGVRTKVSEPLARYTSMKVGGPADVFIEVESAEALTKVLRTLHRFGTNFCLLGNGSNVLISDRGLSGAVIHLAGEFKHVEWREESEIVRVKVGAALCGHPTGKRSGPKGICRTGVRRRDSRDNRRCTLYERRGLWLRIREGHRSS